MGRPFGAIIRLNADNSPEFDFGQGANGDDGNAEEVDFSGQEPLGVCPKCEARVFDRGMSFVCEKSVGPAKSFDFRSGKIILQQPVEEAVSYTHLDVYKRQVLGLLERTAAPPGSLIFRTHDGVLSLASTLMSLVRQRPARI